MTVPDDSSPVSGARAEIQRTAGAVVMSEWCGHPCCPIGERHVAPHDVEPSNCTACQGIMKAARMWERQFPVDAPDHPCVQP